MALVARTRPADLTIGGTGTLMDRCLAAGLPVASACSGRGACARCLITVLEGAPHLTPVRQGAASGQRLSCQCRVADPDEAILITTGYW